MKLTSIQTFERIRAEGLVKKLRLRALEFVAYNPDCTSLDAYYSDGFKTRRYTTVCPRFTELEQMGIIEVSGIITQEGSPRGQYRMTGRVQPRQRAARKSLEDRQSELNRLVAQREKICKRIHTLQNSINSQIQDVNRGQIDWMDEAEKTGTN